jgi:hypothetical protein
VRSERLTVLVSKAEKLQLTEAAAARQVSVAEMVRDALNPILSGNVDAAHQLSTEQKIMLERLAGNAEKTLSRASLALDRAFAELDATRVALKLRHGHADSTGGSAS